MKNILLAAAVALPALAAQAMDVKVVGDQVIMSGYVDGSELASLRDVVANPANAAVRTVVLRNSPGGDLFTSMRAGEFIRDKGWRTAVSGYCFSGCAILFLGGAERHFADDKTIGRTQLGFHAAYHTADGLRSFANTTNTQATSTAMDWIKSHSGGKLSPALLDRFEKLEKAEFVHFFDSTRMARPGQNSVFVCSHSEPDPKKKCRPIGGADVYQEGIVTSTVLVKPNDM